MLIVTIILLCERILAAEFWTIAAVGAASVYIGGKGIRAQGEPYRKSIDNLKRVRGNVSKALSNPKGYRHQINRAVKDIE